MCEGDDTHSPWNSALWDKGEKCLLNRGCVYFKWSCFLSWSIWNSHSLGKTFLKYLIQNLQEFKILFKWFFYHYIFCLTWWVISCYTPVHLVKLVRNYNLCMRVEETVALIAQNLMFGTNIVMKHAHNNKCAKFITCMQRVHARYEFGAGNVMKHTGNSKCAIHNVLATAACTTYQEYMYCFLPCVFTMCMYRMAKFADCVHLCMPKLCNIKCLILSFLTLHRTKYSLQLLTILFITYLYSINC